MPTSILAAVAIVIVLALVVAGYVRVRPLASARRLIRVVRRATGARLERAELGIEPWPYLEWPATTPDAPTLLLIHGFGADKDMWLGYAPRLRREARIIAPDLPGFGDAARDPQGDYSPRTQARRVAQFCQSLRLGKVHVAGSSMGGYIGAWLAVDHPEQVASLTLMGAAGVEGTRASVVQTAAEAGQNPLVVDDEAGLAALLGLLSARPLKLPRFLRRFMLDNFQRHHALLDRIFWQLVEAHQNDGLVDELHRVRAPTLLVWGEDDQIIDASCADVFAEHLPGARMTRLAGVGHIPMIEAPAKTAAAHRELLAGDSA